jgi:A/G-specific adenine glycosylase
MLQQTQVERVIPKFDAFIAAFPDLATLAAASEEEVLTLWSGLGYYRRARLLHRLARHVVEEGGRLPRTAAELERLPGVGPYTAAAVSSLVHGETIPVMDGNVMRVASRFLGLSGDPRRSAGRRIVTNWIQGLLSMGPPGEINEALMELGATVCRPRAARCSACPLGPRCVAKADGCPESYPPPRRRRGAVHLRWVAACCVDEEDRWLVRQVVEGPILEGLWLPPMAPLAPGDDTVEVARGLVAGINDALPRVLDPVQHSITHRRIRIIPVRFSVKGGGNGELKGRWIDPVVSVLPTSSIFSKLIQINNINLRKENE